MLLRKYQVWGALAEQQSRLSLGGGGSQVPPVVDVKRAHLSRCQRPGEVSATFHIKGPVHPPLRAQGEGFWQNAGCGGL